MLSLSRKPGTLSSVMLSAALLREAKQCEVEAPLPAKIAPKLLHLYYATA
jgi:hypothetical protein